MAKHSHISKESESKGFTSKAILEHSDSENENKAEELQASTLGETVILLV